MIKWKSGGRPGNVYWETKAQGKQKALGRNKENAIVKDRRISMQSVRIEKD